MVTAKLYVESGDDSREQGIRIREGWNEFFDTAGIGDRVRVVRGGDRRRTLERLVKSVTRTQGDIVPFALVDRKQPIAEEPRQACGGGVSASERRRISLGQLA